MAAPYLISRLGDPLFAISIGTAAAWVRIRREELERFDAAKSENPVEHANAAPPTHSDTFRILRERLSKVNPREWNWRGVVESKERKRFGIADEP